MPEVFSFEKAIQQTEDEDRALLIGNGFSAKYFTYSVRRQHQWRRFEVVI